MLEKLTPFRESVPWLPGQPTVNVPALGWTPPVQIAVEVGAGGASLENRLGEQCLPGGSGFLKQLELLHRGNCLINITAGLSGEFSSRGWSIDFEDEAHAGPEAGGCEAGW